MTPAHVPALYLLCAPVSTNLFSLVFYSSLSLIFSPVQLQTYVFNSHVLCVILLCELLHVSFPPVLLGKENGGNALISL